jgi:hypothetical protein
MKKLRNRLKLSVVKFSYKKKNGDTRQATGTNNIELLNVVFGLDMKQTTSNNISDDLTIYYDVEKMGWRCLRNENLLEIIND